MAPTPMPRPARRPARRSALWSTGLAVTLVVALAGCAPAAAPEPTGSSTPSASASAGASPSSTPVALPGCDTIYSPALVTALEADSRESQGDVSAPGAGGWATLDPALEALLASIGERVSCTWILPASESGSTTSVARLDAPTRVAVLDALATAGFTATPIDGGELWTIAVEEEFITYTEAHLISETLWIGSLYTFGDAQTLTLDAAALLLP